MYCGGRFCCNLYEGLEHFTFEECLQGAKIAEFNGIEVLFLSIDDLITNKKAVARSKDQIDVIELEKIKRIQEEEDGLINGLQN